MDGIAPYPSRSDNERLLRFMSAGNQVDEMFAVGPMQTEYTLKNPAQRLLEIAPTTTNIRYPSSLMQNGETA